MIKVEFDVPLWRHKYVFGQIDSKIDIKTFEICCNFNKTIKNIPHFFWWKPFIIIFVLINNTLKIYGIIIDIALYRNLLNTDIWSFIIFKITSANVHGMNFCYVLMVHSCCDCLCCLFVLSITWIAWSEGSNMLHYYFIWFSSEPEDLEPAKWKHLIVILSIIDGKEVGEELLFCGEGGISSNPVLSIAHSLIIDIILTEQWYNIFFMTKIWIRNWSDL